MATKIQKIYCNCGGGKPQRPPRPMRPPIIKR